MLESTFHSLYTTFMEMLPTRTVTFLFIDIEGSTKLAAEGSTMTMEQALALTEEK